LAPIGRPRSLEKKEPGRTNNYSVADTYREERYSQLKEKIDKRRSQLKQREHRQIDRISRDQMDWLEKSQILRDLYNKYGNKWQYG
jgi:hypothetical protein